MDVTFIENEPYFNKHQVPVQGEMESEPELLLGTLADPNFETENPGPNLETAGPNFDTENPSPNFATENPDPCFENPNSADPNSANPTAIADPNSADPNSINPSLESGPIREGPEAAKKSGINFWIELDVSNGGVIQSEPRPHGSESPGGIHEVSSQNPTSSIQTILPTRTNRGKPPKRYIPEDGTSK